MSEAVSPVATPLTVLREVYGYSEFRGDQAAVIDHVCSGQDALVLMPTGGGKSICYQIPGVVLPGLAIIVSPLIALMQDQVRGLATLGVRAAYLNSTLSPDQQRDVIRDVEEDQLDLLYIAPERLLQEGTLDLLSRCHISLIAIDEAHCVSSWGHDFRQDYLELHRLADAFPEVPRCLLYTSPSPRDREKSRMPSSA